MALPPNPNRPRVPPPKKKKGPGEASAQQVLDRSRGALLGMAVGDAFGATHQGRRIPAPPFPELCGGVHTEMLGRGPFSLKPGQVTDGTQMALCLATVLKTLKRYDLRETAKEYVRWLPHAFDVAEPTKQALALVAEGRWPENSGRTVWLENNQRLFGHGSLARTTPVGVFFHHLQRLRLDATLADSAITHFDPRCQLSCVAHNAALAAAISAPKQKAEPGDLLKQVEADLSIAAAELGRKHPEFVLQITDAAGWVREDLTLAQDSDPMLYGPELHLLHHHDSVRVPLRLAFWELLHVPSFEAAMIDVANRGGDADVNCAVAGALFGAVYGERAIPEHWAQLVLEALGTIGGPLWAVYHPRFLLPLAGEVPDPNPPAPLPR